MARAELRLPQMLHPFAGGARSVAVQGGDVRQALEDAFARHPLLRPHLFTEEGRVREHVHLFLNERDVRDELDARLRDGDELYVLQAMSGG